MGDHIIISYYVLPPKREMNRFHFSDRLSEIRGKVRLGCNSSFYKQVTEEAKFTGNNLSFYFYLVLK